MEKSALLAAYYPSIPLIPTPTWAAVIIFTSFAPSPIANVLTSGCNFLIIKTRSAFCFGLTLHAKTTWADLSASANRSLKYEIFEIFTKLSPAIISAN